MVWEIQTFRFVKRSSGAISLACEWPLQDLLHDTPPGKISIRPRSAANKNIYKSWWLFIYDTFQYNLASYPKIGGGKRWFFLFNWMTFKNQVLQSQVTLFGPFESRPFHGWKRDVHFWGKKSRSRMEEAGNRSSRIFFSEMYSKGNLAKIPKNGHFV